MQKLLQSLSEADFQVVRATEPKQMSGLDEDELLELHARVRRARNKHVTNYRRAGAGKVGAKGSRAAARNANERNAERAEIFEDALSRVSRQLAVVARRSATELKADRLARASRETAPATTASRTTAAASRGGSRVEAARKSPARKKREAGSRAAGARRQAKRDGKSAV